MDISTKKMYIELLARSNFSFLNGASHPEEMVKRARQLGYQGLALCDINGFYGVVRGFQAAERPSAFDTAHLNQNEQASNPTSTFRYFFGIELTPLDSSPIVLIPMNLSGYQHLCRLITKAKRSVAKTQIDLHLEDILTCRENTLAFPLPPWNEDTLKILLSVFQDRLYLPVTRDLTWESIQLYEQALRFESQLGLPLFATQRPLFHEADRKPLHDILTCILHKTTLEKAAHRLTLNRERYLKPLQQLQCDFKDRPDLLKRTLEIAERVQFSLRELRYRYPQGELPPQMSAADLLAKRVNAGVNWRYPQHLHSSEFLQRVHQQVAHEMQLICEMEYEDYFLTLWEICQFANKEGILFQGRGSAANSVVCFVLGLTNVDPIQLGLLFERFISRERNEPPDIDIDFEHERREEVIQHIYKKYGNQKAAMVCTVIRYRSRMAMREVAKTMGLSLEQINHLIRYMGREGLSNLLDKTVDVARFGLSEKQFQTLIQWAQTLYGFPRHLGIHTGGFVISHDDIINIVPVENATMENRYVIQWNKDDIETLGLMKIDILALGMLSALSKSLQLLKTHKGIDWNLAQIPQNDSATYQMIQKAETIGVFQIESRAQMSLLPRLKPNCYYDLVIEVAIVRPGPIQGGMVHPYLRRRSGKERVHYAHPHLIPILEKTLGVPLFQEQVMQIVVAVAGFTPGEADELRRMMSSAWRKKSIMDGLRHRLLSGMLSHGISKSYAEAIYKTIEGFSSYGFPESHAASFALLTYASCYLKRHHPDIFVCTLLNSQPMGFYSPRQLIADAQRNGVPFLPLNIQHSHWDYQLEPSPIPDKPSTESLDATPPRWAIRVGLRSIYGLSYQQAQNLIEQRMKNGPYLNLRNLIQRTHLPKHILMRLGAAGAFTCFGISARESLWMIQGLSFDKQSLIYGESLTGSHPAENKVQLLPKESSWQSLQREYHTKGFSLEAHPLSLLRPQLNQEEYPFQAARNVQQMRHLNRIRVAGLVSHIQRPPTAKGMCFVSLEDETGIMNIVISPDVYQKHRLTLLSYPLLEIVGLLEKVDGVCNIKAQNLRALLPSLFQSSAPKAKFFR